MPTLEDAFDSVREALAEHFGERRDEFQGLAPFEAIVAVLLARAIGPRKWNAALDALSEACLLTPRALAQAEVVEIGDALREKGLAVSAIALARLKHVARWLVQRHEGRLDWLFDPHQSTSHLRGELALVNGVGLASADAILLHALKRRSYPVDRATFRVLVRHGWLDPSATYDEARDLLVQHAVAMADPEVKSADLEYEEAPSVLAELASGMDQLGRRFCTVSAARCTGCPLESLLPEGGPRELDG